MPPYNIDSLEEEISTYEVRSSQGVVSGTVSAQNLERAYQALQRNDILTPQPIQRMRYSVPVSGNVFRAHEYSFSELKPSKGPKSSYTVYKQAIKKSLYDQSPMKQKEDYIKSLNADTLLKMHSFIASDIKIGENNEYDIHYDHEFEGGLYIMFKKNNTENGFISSWDDRVSFEQFKDSIKLCYISSTRIGYFINTHDENGIKFIESSSSAIAVDGNTFFDTMGIVFINNTDGYLSCKNDDRTYYYKESDMPKNIIIFRHHDFNDRELSDVIKKTESIVLSDKGILHDITVLKKKLAKEVNAEFEELRRMYNVNLRRPNIHSKKHQGNTKGTYLSHLIPFSCEIECYGPNKSITAQMSHKISKDIGMSGDGSLQSGLGYPIEIQTPILKGKRGEVCVAELSSTLVEMGFKTDKSCGLHIHLDGTCIGLTEESVYSSKSRPLALINLYLAYRIFEPVILSFLPSTRRNNRYCADFTQSSEYHGDTIKFHPLKESFEIMSSVNTLKEFEVYWYKVKTSDQLSRAKSSRYTPSRYYGVNFHSLLKDNHIEIRYHSGTLNYEKILYWTDLHGKIIEKVCDGTITTEMLKGIMDAELDVDKLTQQLFSILDLNKDTVEYLYDRQCKFKDAKASEEILIDKTKKLGVV